MACVDAQVTFVIAVNSTVNHVHFVFRDHTTVAAKVTVKSRSRLIGLFLTEWSAHFSQRQTLPNRDFHTSHLDDDTTPQYTLLTVNLKPQFASTTSKSSSAGGAGAAGIAAVEAAPTAGGAGACFATISNAPSFGANA